MALHIQRHVYQLKYRKNFKNLLCLSLTLEKLLCKLPLYFEREKKMNGIENDFEESCSIICTAYRKMRELENERCRNCKNKYFLSCYYLENPYECGFFEPSIKREDEGEDEK